MEIPSSPIPSAAVAGKLAGLETGLKQTSALLNSIPLPAGTPLTAQVAQQVPVSSSEKQQLLTLVPANIAPASHQALRQLLASPQLTLLTLKLSPDTPKLAGKQFTSLSAEPLPTTAPLRLLVRADGQLQLMPPTVKPPIAKNDLEKPVAAPRQPGSGAATPVGAAPASRPNNRLTELANPSNKPQLENELSQLLRTALPKAQTSAPLMQMLTQLAKPVPSGAALTHLPEPVTKLLAVLQQQADTLSQLSQNPGNGQLLKQLIQTSGVLLESQLRMNLPITNNSAPPSLPPQDLKAQLLSAIQSLNTQPAIPDAEIEQDSEKISQLLRGLLNGTASESQLQNPKHLNAAKFLLQEALLPLLQKNLARIQTQQSQTASALLQEPNLTHIQCDIPLRLPDGFGNLALHIQELPYYNLEEDKAQKSTEAKQKTRQWRVFMEFDLREFGVLAAQIHWLPQQLRAQLWANNSSLRKKTQSHLRDLEDNLKAAGLPLDSLICNSDLPPKKTINIQYSLVDIST